MTGFFKNFYASCWLQPECSPGEHTPRPGYHGSSPERLTGKGRKPDLKINSEKLVRKYKTVIEKNKKCNKEFRNSTPTRDFL